MIQPDFRKAIFPALLYRIIRPVKWRRTAPGLESLADSAFVSAMGWHGTSEDFVTEIHRSSRLRFFFHPRNRKDFFLNTLTTTQSLESILEEADLVLKNRFQTLGSSLVDLGDPIPWQRDFKSGKEWPLRKLSVQEILDLEHPSDVKVPWELSRFHQVWWLGKASWLTGNPAYAEKFGSLVSDWIEKNPVGQGVNWTVAMEASIRACNWIAGYYFFCESQALKQDFWLRFFRHLLIHGLFIEAHLEYSGVNGNHFLSNIVGLIYLGVFFHDLPCGKRWLRWAVPQLETAMQEQVYDDGVNHEHSTSYHRLVLELFYSAALLCKRNNIRLSDGFWKRLEKMFEYVLAYSRPDGSIPLIGDSDDGRLFRISMNQDVNDHRHALSVGAVLFKRADFKQAAGRFDQEALWYFGGEGFEIHQMLRETAHHPGSRGFSQAGFYIMRTEDAHVFLDAGEIGLRGRGGHGHNDTLSFSLWTMGLPLVVDSGTYAYTSDPEMRNTLRGTRGHNTVMVDEAELAEFAGLWSVKKDITNPRIIQWKPSSEIDVLEAEHYGYTRLSSPVIHRRKFEVRKRQGKIVITDVLQGSGVHKIESNIHLAPTIEPSLVDGQTVRFELPTCRCRIRAKGGQLHIKETAFSPSFGILMTKKTLTMTSEAMLPLVLEWEFHIEPHVPA